MEKVLVSACLLGAKVRYHGGSAEVDDPVLWRWSEEGRLIAVCPEVEGGLPTPRPPAEIRRTEDSRLLIVRADGRDVSEPCFRGAEAAVQLAKRHRIRMAVLKDGSPSCASRLVHDGTFTGMRVAGEGITTSRLREIGVRVFDETRIAEAAAWLDRLERHQNAEVGSLPQRATEIAEATGQVATAGSTGARNARADEGEGPRE